jgi:hypothetical protein
MHFDRRDEQWLQIATSLIGTQCCARIRDDDSYNLLDVFTGSALDHVFLLANLVEHRVTTDTLLEATELNLQCG